MPAAAARADNNNRRASGLRRWRKTRAIMTKGLTDSSALHPTIPEDQTGFVSARRLREDSKTDLAVAFH